MKYKIIVFIGLMLAFTTQKVEGQISFSFNIGIQPLWGPVGYNHVENYYLPEIDAYYNVDSRMYTYIINGRWVNTMSLPWKYRNYDLYRGYKVVMNDYRPYLHYDTDRVKYATFRRQHYNQQAIRDSRDQKYFENKNHPQHNEWKGNGNQNDKDQHDNRNNNNGKNKGKNKNRD